MTKLLAALAAGLIAGAGLVGENSDASQPLAGAAAISGDTPGWSYHLRRGGGSVSCMVERGTGLSDDLWELRVEPSCEAVMPGLAQVRYWRRTDDQTVVFSRDGDDELVTFAPADGAAYETFSPGAPLLSLAVTE